MYQQKVICQWSGCMHPDTTTGKLHSHQRVGTLSPKDTELHLWIRQHQAQLLLDRYQLLPQLAKPFGLLIDVAHATSGAHRGSKKSCLQYCSVDQRLCQFEKQCL